MDGKSYIDNLFYDIGRYTLLTTDTNLRIIALAWANRVIKDISSRKPHWVWLEKTSSFPTVIDQVSYDLPTDIDLSGRKVVSVRQTSTPAKLVYVSQHRMDELEADPTVSSGNPLFYTLWSSYIRLFPMPSAVITMYMRYIKTITPLTDSAVSTTDIPDKFSEVVLDGMKVHAFRMFPKWGDSNAQKVIYEQGILRMIEDDNAEIDADNISGAHIPGNDGLIPPYHFDNTNVG